MFKQTRIENKRGNVLGIRCSTPKGFIFKSIFKVNSRNNLANRNKPQGIYSQTIVRSIVDLRLAYEFFVSYSQTVVSLRLVLG